MEKRLGSDPEKDYEANVTVASAGRYGLEPTGPVEIADEAPPEDLHRSLKSRHASMLAVGGAIGTGLIIGSGAGLAHAGPVGLLIAFMYVGTLCFSMMAVGLSLVYR